MLALFCVIFRVICCDKIVIIRLVLWICDQIFIFNNNEKTTQNRDFPKIRGFRFGGEGGIRTLDELQTHTRVPVVRHKPD